MRVVYVGTGGIGLPSLRRLLELPGVEVAGLVTQPDRAAGRGLKVEFSPLKQLALERDLAVLQPPRLRDADAVAGLAALRPDLLVVMAYGQILPPAVLDLPALGAINLHASLLPRHRGAAPVHAAILAGDELSGVTVMWMDEGLDTGDIILARECGIGAAETAGSLHDKLAALAPGALEEALGLIRAGTAPRIPQEASLATWAPKLDRSSGAPDWNETAAAVALRIRAMHPWPGSSVDLATADGKTVRVKIHRAAAVDGSGGAGEVAPGTLRVACGGGGSVELLEVQPAGGRRMTGEDFLRGHPVVRVA
jgi:methionyl-tRNA formyltransferase